MKSSTNKSTIIIGLIMMFILFSSCSTTYRVRYSNNEISNFVGMSRHEIICHLGAPDSETDDGSYGYIMVFKGNDKIFKLSKRYSNKSGRLPELQLFMDPSGKCVKTMTTNTSSVKAFSPGKTIALLVVLSTLGLIII